MKKEELKKLIESRKIIRNYYGADGEFFGTPLKDFEKKYVNGEEFILTEDEWLPKIDDIKDEIEVLKNEIRNTINGKNEAVNYLKNYKCDHPVRISNCSDRGLNWYNEDTCILCGEKLEVTTIRRKDIKAFSEKNKRFATFIGKEKVTPGGFYGPNDISYKINYTEDDIFKILLDMLDNIKSEEFDIIHEIERLKLDKCIINKPHNKKLILVIVGSNKEYVGDNNISYFTSKNYIDDKKIIDKLLELYGVSVEVIGDEDTIKKYKCIDGILFLDDYNTLRNLNDLLQYQDDIPYSLIVDASRLYTYKVDGSKTGVEKYDLDLKSIFPNLPIINIEGFLQKDTTLIDSKLLDELVKKAIKNSSNISGNSGRSCVYVDSCGNIKHTKNLVKKLNK